MELFWSSLRFITIDILLRAAYFPAWWYAKGFMNILLFVWRQIQSLAASLSLSVLTRNLFQPMYGLRDRTSRVISFFVRLAHLVILFFVECVWTILVAALAVVWLLFPLLVLVNLLYQFGLTDENLLFSIFV